MLTTTIAYDIVTPESVEHSEAAERGYYMPGGWHHPMPTDPTDLQAWLNDDFTIAYDSIRDIATTAIYDSYTVDDSSDSLIWSGDNVDRTGQLGTETRRMHKGDELSFAEWAQIKTWVKARHTPDEDE